MKCPYHGAPLCDCEGTNATMIIVYTRPGCVQCEYTKRKLTERNLEFREINVDVNKEGRKVVEDSGNLQLPYVVTDHGHWWGFRPEKIKGIPQ